MDCPKCGGKNKCKDGFIKERQRYLCKDCKHRYTVQLRAGTGSKEVKRFALQLYLEGNGFRAIGRILKFSNVTILNWIREFGEQLKPIKADKPVEIIEMDEMHTYIHSKKTIAGYGLLLIEMKEYSSAARLVQGELSRVKFSGKPSKI